MEMENQDLWCGRMSLELSAPTEEKTSEPSSKKRQESSIKTPLFLDLRKDNGLLLGALWETGGALLGEYTMRSFGESPSAVVESRLSQILEANPHPKYCLSAVACKGIINRSERRGKKLPEQLQWALERQAREVRCVNKPIHNEPPAGPHANETFSEFLDRREREYPLYEMLADSIGVDMYNQSETGHVSKTMSNRATDSDHVPCVRITKNEPNAQNYKANGDDGNGVSFALIGEHENRGTDMTNIVALSFGNGQVHDAMCPDSNVAKTLNCLADPAKVVTFQKTTKVNAPIALEGNGSRQSHYGAGYREGEVMYTLNTVEEHAVCVDTQDNSSAMITYGLDRASYNQGQNAQFDFSVEEEKIGAQTAMGPGAVCQSVVRRLTPLECERLQGFPDGWTDIGDWVDSDGKMHKGDADSPRYKALGNSIALPFWQWMAGRMEHVLRLSGDKTCTMASLFDGIGGFPLVFQRVGVTPLWASEIEEFCIAVTKSKF